jgi:hypothetical protein
MWRMEYDRLLISWAQGAGLDPPGAAEAANVAYAAERKVQADILRELVGNPYRPIARDPAWRRWNGRALLVLAGEMYESRDFRLVPLLADMLEDAGVTDPQLLDHLRGPGPHTRGCFAVDLVLGLS